MKKILITLLLLTACAFPVRAVVISDFSTLPGGTNFTGGLGTWTNGTNQFTVTSGVLTIGPVSGGNPDNQGYFAFADIVGVPLNASGLTLLSVTARIDSGNAAPGFIINLFDGSGTGALTATFSETSFNSSGFMTGQVLVSSHPNGGSISDIQSFGIAGTGTTASFRISFDSISLAAIPEPSTYAAILGTGALGLAFWRRRRLSGLNNSAVGG